jgi:hypothetical protein
VNKFTKKKKSSSKIVVLKAINGTYYTSRSGVFCLSENVNQAIIYKESEAIDLIDNSRYFNDFITEEI